MPIKLYNTLTKKKEELIPNKAGEIGMYVCGPTVYNFIHIGNARTFLNFDVIRRYLTWRGFKVTFVQNITDIDDKIINRANEEGIDANEVAKKYTLAFEEQMAELGVEAPTQAPKATQTIPEMIKLVEDLEARDMAYETPDGIYFPVRRFAGYGKLSGRTLEEMRAGERVEVDPNKEDPMDFALWKKAKPGEPHWQSPWGEGRPGWHLECSAMSLKYLGMSFDIHGGAQDLIFPHHENEIAQSEAATGQEPFVRYWVHAGLLNIDQEKMSKSLGNFTLLKDVLNLWPANVIRMFMLGTHYRNPLDFTEEGLKEAAAKIDRIQTTLASIDFALASSSPENKINTKRLEDEIKVARDDFIDSMDDDFNTAAALGGLFGFIREINSMIEGAKELPAAGVLQRAKEILTELFGVLGLRLTIKAPSVVPEETINRLAAKFGPPPAELSAIEYLDSLLERRDQARREKKWALADKIRRDLASVGVEIDDTPQGPRWRVKDGGRPTTDGS